MWSQRLVAPSTFELTEVPRPSVADLREGEVLLRVAAGGICGSDLPHFAGRVSGSLAVDAERHAAAVPGYPLHEVVGTVIGSQCRDLAVGAEVVGWASGTNALSEYVVVVGSGVCAYDAAALTPTEAVTLQPLACVLFTLAQLGPLAGKRVAVVGQGPIGVLFSHALRTAGAGEVIGVDVLSHPDLLSTFGVDQFVHSTSDRWAATIQDEERPDVVIEAVGHQVGTLTDAIEAIAPDGTIYYFGVTDDAVYPVALTSMLRKNLTLKSGYVRPPSRREALLAAAEYLAAHPGLAGRYVTDVFGHMDAELAFRRAAHPVAGQHKIVVSMSMST
ncbi:alcohol dehydrogenase [Aeromicrobium sp. A1-2]|nr:alcohol dehydrogenase [Aeromicrobium sp. A1-2]